MAVGVARTRVGTIDMGDSPLHPQPAFEVEGAARVRVIDEVARVEEVVDAHADFTELGRMEREFGVRDGISARAAEYVRIRIDVGQRVVLTPRVAGGERHRIAFANVIRRREIRTPEWDSVEVL